MCCSLSMVSQFSDQQGQIKAIFPCRNPELNIKYGIMTIHLPKNILIRTAPLASYLLWIEQGSSMNAWIMGDPFFNRPQ